MSGFFPQGGMISGTSVILAYFESGTKTLWILTKTSSFDYDLIFRSAIIIDSNGVVTTDADVINNIATYTLNIPEAGTMSLSPDFNYVTVAGDGNVVTTGTTEATLTYSQTKVQDWNNPPQLLTGVPYILVGGNTSLSFLFDDGSTGGLIRQINPFFIPTVAFFGCTSSATNQLSNLNDIVRLSYCSATSSLSTSACSGLPSAAWTTQSDCINGFIYRYCKPGVYCSGKCQSTCQQEGQSCIYTVINRDITVMDPALEGPYSSYNIPTVEYICQNNVNPTGPVNSVGTSWWVIIAIIVIAIIIIIGLILIYQRIISDNAKKEKTAAGVSSDVKVSDIDAGPVA